jgi:hypothetical protein
MKAASGGKEALMANQDWCDKEAWDDILGRLRSATENLKEQQERSRQAALRLDVASQWLQEYAKSLRSPGYAQKLVYLPPRSRKPPPGSAAEAAPKTAREAEIIPFPAWRIVRRSSS